MLYTCIFIDISPAELRANSKECVEISEEEFQTVSTLVRGRVVLADVNKVRNEVSLYNLRCNKLKLNSLKSTAFLTAILIG